MQYIGLLIVLVQRPLIENRLAKRILFLKAVRWNYCTVLHHCAENLCSDSMAYWWYTNSPDPISQHLFPNPQLKFPVTAALRILLQAYIVRSRLLILKHKFSVLRVSRRAPWSWSPESRAYYPSVSLSQLESCCRWLPWRSLPPRQILCLRLNGRRVRELRCIQKGNCPELFRGND